jgi:peptidoglycan/xylan/chitin deacetylase (PgdA/CDA1 family)
VPIRRQDVGVLLAYLVGYSRMRNSLFRLRHNRDTRIVIFHDILPESVRQFEAHLRFMKAKMNVVSLSEFFLGKLSADRTNVVITFDDGFKSWVTVAIPLLKELKLPAVFFVSSGFLGLSKDDEAEFAHSKLLLSHPSHSRITGCIDSEDVKTMAEEGYTVGGHTLNHTNLVNLRDSARLRHEIVDDKQRLEEITGAEIEYFSYPFGAWNNPDIDVADVLRESGYKGAVTTVSGPNNALSHPYRLCREITHASMGSLVFRARARGNYDAVQLLKQWVPVLLQRRFKLGGFSVRKE